MELHDGGLDQIVAEEPVVVEEVGAGAGEGGLSALLGLAILVHKAQLILVIKPVVTDNTDMSKKVNSIMFDPGLRLALLVHKT